MSVLCVHVQVCVFEGQKVIFLSPVTSDGSTDPNTVHPVFLLTPCGEKKGKKKQPLALSLHKEKQNVARMCFLERF